MAVENVALHVVVLLLTPQANKCRILPNVVRSCGYCRARTQAFKTSVTGGKPCNIGRGGPCSASTHSARRVAIGCERTPRPVTAAAIAVRNYTASRLRWAHGCGCGHVR